MCLCCQTCHRSRPSVRGQRSPPARSIWVDSMKHKLYTHTDRHTHLEDECIPAYLHLFCVLLYSECREFCNASTVDSIRYVYSDCFWVSQAVRVQIIFISNLSFWGHALCVLPLTSTGSLHFSLYSIVFCQIETMEFSQKKVEQNCTSVIKLFCSPDICTFKNYYYVPQVTDMYLFLYNAFYIKQQWEPYDKAIYVFGNYK